MGTSENAAYFMGLFFFYSGFFVPKSFDKKGQRSFLFERVKRLGIPQVVYSFLIGPYIEGGLKYLLWDKNDQTDPVFTPSLYNSGTTWFLQQLIVFGILYSFVCIAQRNNWMTEIKTNRSRIAIYV